MSPEAQRIAIAEACGWRPCASADPDFETMWTRGERYCYALPYYLGDLNAVHEAEKVLTTDLVHRYKLELSRCQDADIKCHGTLAAYAFHATAAHRCEALLKTLGKWEEAKP